MIISLIFRILMQKRTMFALFYEFLNTRNIIFAVLYKSISFFHQRSENLYQSEFHFAEFLGKQSHGISSVADGILFVSGNISEASVT